jgi:hypothetical protein
MKNEPAFPQIDTSKPYIFQGLTKREYFAGLAMQGLTAGNAGWQGYEKDEYAKHCAITSVELANALIAELSKEGE